MYIKNKQKKNSLGWLATLKKSNVIFMVHCMRTRQKIYRFWKKESRKIKSLPDYLCSSGIFNGKISLGWVTLTVKNSGSSIYSKRQFTESFAQGIRCFLSNNTLFLRCCFLCPSLTQKHAEENEPFKINCYSFKSTHKIK